MPPKKDTAASNKRKSESFVKRTTFFVNREWQTSGQPEQWTNICGQMYVESLEPQKKSQKWPLILVHGDYHSSQVWLTKPDGNPGWASYFVGKGFHVYLVDLPATGKSNNLTREAIAMAEVTSIKASQIERDVTAPELFNQAVNLRWSAALKHDKWPGSGMRGDTIFERYCASLTPLFFTPEERQTLAQNALKKLLQVTGKAVLIGEGTGATASWLAADVVPDLVVGVVAIEPPGPPFCETTVLRNEVRKYDSFTAFNSNRLKYGLSNIPLTFDPPARPDISLQSKPNTHPLDLALFEHTNTGKKMVLQYSPHNIPNGFCLEAQMTHGEGAMHVRKLTNLSKMRHVLFTGEASNHSEYDISTIHFMIQAGLSVDCGFLEKYKTHGNGHLMFLELNSDDVAAHIMRWIQNRAGHIEEPVVVVEPEVTVMPTPAVLSSPRRIIEDLETNRSPKRARQDAPHTPRLSLTLADQSFVIDLTNEPSSIIDHRHNGSLHTNSDAQSTTLSARSSAASLQQGAMPPPPRPSQQDWPRPSTREQEERAFRKIKIETPESRPSDSELLMPREYPAQGQGLFASILQLAQAGTQCPEVIKRESNCADSRNLERPQSPSDVFYTAPEYPTQCSVAWPVANETRGPFNPHAYNLSQTSVQNATPNFQQTAPLPQQTAPFLLAPRSTTSSWQQFSPICPLQCDIDPTSGFDRAPRLMPEFETGRHTIDSAAHQIWDAATGAAHEGSIGGGPWTDAKFCLSEPGGDELHYLHDRGSGVDDRR